LHEREARLVRQAAGIASPAGVERVGEGGERLPDTVAFRSVHACLSSRAARTPVAVEVNDVLRQHHQLALALVEGSSVFASVVREGLFPRGVDRLAEKKLSLDAEVVMNLLRRRRER